MLSTKKILYRIINIIGADPSTLTTTSKVLVGSMNETAAAVSTLASNLWSTVYPVGSFYETSDTSFDPNVSWGGTWSLETEGLVHIGAGLNYTAGDTGGSATHTLTIDEMPSHNHSVTTNATNASGVTNYIKSGTNSAVGYSNTSSVGGGDPHNNMQPYVVVNRWHRTA